MACSAHVGANAGHPETATRRSGSAFPRLPKGPHGCARSPAMSQVIRALISVSDKAGVVEFARRLAKLDVEILSTGGTSRALREAGWPCAT
jgi:hypothetical protein